ncbi:hypothetical protein OG216_45355 [Streptomycetaceae bacterium NBC_01309]
MTTTDAAAGAPPPSGVTAAWARIDVWLSEHAPRTFASLRPPASLEAIAEAERALGVAFHPDLVLSLRCHDGVAGTGHDPAAMTAGLYGPFASVAELVSDARSLREVAEGFDDLEFDADDDGEPYEMGAFWRDDWLLVTRGIGADAQDGLFLVSRDGRHGGRLGNYFNEDIPDFAAWETLPEALYALADALEHGHEFGGQRPVAWDGAVAWESKPTVIAAPVSLLEHAGRHADPAGPPPGEAPVMAPRCEPAQGAAPAPEQLSAAAEFGYSVTAGSGGRPDTPLPPAQRGVVFVQGAGADELLRAVGAVKETFRPRTGEAARASAASPWAAQRPVLRAGTCGGWGFLLDESDNGQSHRPEVLRRVSAAGRRAVSVRKDGPQCWVTVYEDGVPYAGGSADRHELAPRADREHAADGTEFQIMGIDPFPGATQAYARFLRDLEDPYGIVFDPAVMDATELPGGLVLPLLTALPGLPRYAPGVEPAPPAWSYDEAVHRLLDAEPEHVVRATLTAQLRRQAAETGIAAYPEIAATLDALDRGTPVDTSDGGALDVCLRTLAAEFHAHDAYRRKRGVAPTAVSDEDHTAWARRAGAGHTLRCFVAVQADTAVNTRDAAREAGAPATAANSALGREPAAAASLRDIAAGLLHSRLSLVWRTELVADVAHSRRQAEPEPARSARRRAALTQGHGFDALTQLVPPPEEPWLGDGMTWDDLRAAVGSRLPREYMTLMETYGAGSWNGWWRFLPPLDSQEIGVLDKARDCLSTYADFREEFPEMYPLAIWPEPGGFFPFALSIDGDYLGWLTQGDPDQWPLIVTPRHSDQGPPLPHGLIDVMLAWSRGTYKDIGFVLDDDVEDPLEHSGFVAWRRG